MYRLTCDNSGHWYVIPCNKNADWQDYLDAVDKYWESEGREPLPDLPGWADILPGGVSWLTFSSYEINTRAT
jgi:hypothetical protein